MDIAIVSLILIHWIVIYQVDSSILHLNNPNLICWNLSLRKGWPLPKDQDYYYQNETQKATVHTYQTYQLLLSQVHVIFLTTLPKLPEKSNEFGTVPKMFLWLTNIPEDLQRLPNIAFLHVHCVSSQDCFVRKGNFGSLYLMTLHIYCLSHAHITGTIHATKIPTGPTGKSGRPQKVDQFFETFPVGPNGSTEFWTKISRNFGWMDRAL